MSEQGRCEEAVVSARLLVLYPFCIFFEGLAFFPKFKRLGKIIKFFVQYITVFCLITQQNTNQSTNLYSCLT